MAHIFIQSLLEDICSVALSFKHEKVKNCCVKNEERELEREVRPQASMSALHLAYLELKWV